MAIVITKLAPETLTRATSYSGTVKEWQRVELSFRVGGTVSELRRVGPPGNDRDLHEGDRFPQGTVLSPGSTRRTTDATGQSPPSGSPGLKPSWYRRGPMPTAPRGVPTRPPDLRQWSWLSGRFRQRQVQV